MLWNNDGTYTVGIADERAKATYNAVFSRIHDRKHCATRNAARAAVRALRKRFPTIRLVWGETLLEGR